MTLAAALRTALRAAPALELPTDLIESCIDSGHVHASETEAQFRRAYHGSLTDVPRHARLPGLNGVTGHIAESVVESMLVDAGFSPLEHFVGPFSGGHGIDLALLAPDYKSVFAVEVKGTLSPRRWPTLRAGDQPQLSAEWLAKSDNPAAASLQLDPTGFGVLAVVIQFGRRAWRAAYSTDLQNAQVITSPDELTTLSVS